MSKAKITHQGQTENPFTMINFQIIISLGKGAQWLSGGVLDSSGFEPHRRCVVVLEQDTFILA